jgi:hypothetical protein
MRQCFACGRKLGVNPWHVATDDGQAVMVGSNCFKRIGPAGYKPNINGPRLYRAIFAVDGFVWRIIEIIKH